MFMMNASKQASPFLPSFFSEGQFSEPFNPNLDIKVKPSLVDEKGLRLVEEPPNSERKGASLSTHVSSHVALHINGAPIINLSTCFAPYVVNGANCGMELFDGFLDYAPLKFLVFFIVENRLLN
ncbi:hypothetical protein OROGR_022994 [Orobanche gracilis]